MKDKIWLFVLGIRLVDDEIQMTQPELLSVAEIEASLWQKYYVHSCTPHCLKIKLNPKGLQKLNAFALKKLTFANFTI